jgi:MGT family glycosyltransferase
MSTEPKILVSATTAVPQPEFYKMAIAAFESLPFRVILSIGNEIDPGSLGPLPTRFEINQFSSQLEILEQASLYIGQGGVGSTLEALYCGVPVLLIPPGPGYDPVPRRIAELGLGMRLEGSAISIEELRNAAVFLLEDGETQKRAMEARKTMRETNGAKLAGDLIDAYIRR